MFLVAVSSPPHLTYYSHRVTWKAYSGKDAYDSLLSPTEISTDWHNLKSSSIAIFFSCLILSLSQDRVFQILSLEIVSFSLLTFPWKEGCFLSKSPEARGERQEKLEKIGHLLDLPSNLKQTYKPQSWCLWRWRGPSGRSITSSQGWMCWRGAGGTHGQTLSAEDRGELPGTHRCPQHSFGAKGSSSSRETHTLHCCLSITIYCCPPSWLQLVPWGTTQFPPMYCDLIWGVLNVFFRWAGLVF